MRAARASCYAARMSVSGRVIGAALFACLVGSAAVAAPPAPTGAHPRIFLDPDTIAALKADAAKPATATARAVAKCDDVIAHPDQWKSGGYQGLGFVEPLS